mmetsp:Transcript_6040/g.22846  ORF Transcript_6040/g.22846 Transcript_6040/m.22846 type:complete len:298 (-) Transcript_6040:280-1173(-)
MSASVTSTSSKHLEPYTKKFYLTAGIGGALSCGITHLSLTPVDLVKCKIQTGAQFNGLAHGIRSIYSQGGLRALSHGWGPTLAGYASQGTVRFAGYEYFKKIFGDAVDPETKKKFQVPIYIAAAASGEFLADFLLAPFEAVKVRVQTQPGYAKGLMDGMPKMLAQEGIRGLYKGLPPLWMRQIPYTIVKFSLFEKFINVVYGVMGKEKHNMSSMELVAASFAAGYMAGAVCAVASHPGDVIVSKLNKTEGGTFTSVARSLGWRGMWQGLGPRIVMIGAIAGGQWAIYDSFKTTVGFV